MQPDVLPSVLRMTRYRTVCKKRGASGEVIGQSHERAASRGPPASGRDDEQRFARRSGLLANERFGRVRVLVEALRRHQAWRFRRLPRAVGLPRT